MTRFAPTTLTGPGFTLRAPRADDIDPIVEACRDALVQRWLPLPTPYERDHARSFVEEFAPEQITSGDGIVFALDDGTGIVGCVDLKHTVARTRCTEVGYWAAPAGRGRGLVTSAVRLLSEWAIRSHLIERVELRAAVDNAASNAVAARAGFTREGVARNAGIVHGGRVDLVVHSLVSGDL